MKFNFLEELISEWYQFQGFFVRQNVLVGKMPKGGHECELDIVAFHPERKRLVHLEPSMDADSWAVREKRYKKKFEAGQKHIPGLFLGLEIPNQIDQFAVFGILKSNSRPTIAGGKVLSVECLLTDIFRELNDQKMYSQAVPEHYPILRSFQLLSDHRNVVMNVWRKTAKQRVS